MSESIFILLLAIILIFQPIALTLTTESFFIPIITTCSFILLMNFTENKYKNKDKVILITFILSTLVSEIAYDFAMTCRYIDFSYQSPMIAVLLGLLMIIFSKKIKATEKDIIYIYAVMFILSIALKISYGILIITFVAFYLMFNKNKETFKEKIKTIITIGLFSVFIFLISDYALSGIDISGSIIEDGAISYFLSYISSFFIGFIKYIISNISYVIGTLISCVLISLPIKENNKKNIKYLGIIPYIIYPLSMFICLFIKYI